jgi:transposase
MAWSGRVPPRSALGWSEAPRQGAQTIRVVGIDIGKSAFHVAGLDDRGAIVLRQKWSRGQVQARLTNLSPCLIGMEACVGACPSAASSRPRCAAHARKVRTSGLTPKRAEERLFAAQSRSQRWCNDPR